MAPKRHMSYTDAFKFQVIERAEYIRNCAAAHELEVEERCIGRWQLDKATLKNMTKTKRARRSRIVHWPESEDILKKWTLEQREKDFLYPPLKFSYNH